MTCSEENQSAITGTKNDTNELNDLAMTRLKEREILKKMSISVTA